MMDHRKSRFALIGMATLLAIMPAAPALADVKTGTDVKTGVDAWTRGDYAGAIRAWQGPADAGDPDAQFNLAQAYRFGRGVKQDLGKAEALYGAAADKGHLQASDNYGLLLFQRGEYAKALPFVRAAADRGDPRAQYLLGIAHFNGDIVPKDWVRAYALESLARQAGLPQAASAIQQMDQVIPLEQRQQAAGLASQLAEETSATRARQMAAVDLRAEAPAGAAPPPDLAMRTPRPPAIAGPEIAAPAPLRPPGSAMRSPMPTTPYRPAVAAGPLRPPGSAARSPLPANPRSAGADFTRPPAPVAAPPPPRPAASPAPATASPPRIATKPPAPTPAVPPAAPGPWRVQLGAFGVPGNADALWNKVKARPELAGRARLLVPAGGVTKLQAGGFASQSDAQAACTRLAAAGYSCLVARN